MTDLPTISIIIPVGNDVPGLVTTLSSLQQAEGYGPTVEVIVCNDGGSEAVSRAARESGCVEALLAVNRGSYAARNAGIALARGQALAFLDADQHVDHNWIKQGLQGLDTADYVGGKIVIEMPANGDRWHLYDQIHAFPVQDYLRRKHFAPTANLFVRRHVVDEVGAFNPALRSGGDWEFGARVASRGFRQAYRAEAITYHASRSREEQFKKLRRTASGIVDVRIISGGEHPAKLAAPALVKLASMPFQLASQGLKWALIPSHRSQPEFSFAMIRKAHTTAFEYWTLHRAVERLVARGENAAKIRTLA